MICFHCQKEINLSEKPGFRAECPFCSNDLHICKNCNFYDEKSYNECKESSADRIVDKEKANFCEYFQVAENSIANPNTEKDEALKALEALFKS
jgi:hypothetical protein